MGTSKAKPGGAADERRSGRSTVLLAATVEFDGTRLPVRVINLSAHGALVQGEVLPGGDEEVTFRCSEVTAKGWMAWVRSPLAGINFEEPIKPDGARSKSKSGAHMVTRDTRELDFRRPGFRGNQMSDEEREIVAKWLREQQKPDDDHAPAETA